MAYIKVCKITIIRINIVMVNILYEKEKKLN